MAVVITSPQFSFLQIDILQETCSWITPPCLPMFTPSDLSFQMYVAVSGTDKDWFNIEFDASGTLSEYTIQARICEDCDDASDVDREFSWGATWTKITEDTTDIWVGNFTFNGNETKWTALDFNTCFNICFHKVLIAVSDPTVVVGLTTTPIECTDTCFTKIVDECYTSVITYGNNDNAFDFNYENSWSNTIRLFMYLHSPLPVEEEKSYAKSNGSTKKLMHRIWTDYKVKTDYFTDDMHMQLTIATAHDTVSIYDVYSRIINKEFVRTEKFDIAWMEEQSPGINVAQATTTLRLAIPRATINSNCE